MTEEALAPDPGPETAARITGRWRGWADALILSVGPIVLALVAGGILLAVIGRDPIAFYDDVELAWQTNNPRPLLYAI